MFYCLSVHLSYPLIVISLRENTTFDTRQLKTVVRDYVYLRTEIKCVLPSDVLIYFLELKIEEDSIRWDNEYS